MNGSLKLKKAWHDDTVLPSGHITADNDNRNSQCQITVFRWDHRFFFFFFFFFFFIEDLADVIKLCLKPKF